jgi:tetratricopeptide (TPR) repeat protein
MAAARMKVLRVEQVADRLDDRFHLLTGGSRTSLPHQQTLRGTIDWSYDLLADKERNLLQKLSVFVGGWDLEAAEFVCEGNGIETYDVMDLLDSLVGKSLVLAERQPGKETRFHMLETIHQYALEKFLESGSTEQARQQHFEYYSSLMKQAHRARYRDEAGYEVAKWLDQIELEHDNLRTALNWIICVQDAESASQLVEALHWFWVMHDHYHEACEWSLKVLAICSQGSHAYATILRIIGNQNFALGNYDEARAHLEESVNLFQEFGDISEFARAVQSLGWIAIALGEYDDAHRLIEQSLNLSQQLADKYEIAWAYLSLGELARAEDNQELAYQYHTQSLALFRELNATGPISIELSNLGFVVLHQGNYQRATDLFEEGLLISLRLGTKSHHAVVMGGLASVAQMKGQSERAARLFGASAAIHEDLGRAIDPGDVADFKDFQAASRAALSEQAFTAAWTEGQAMSLGQAIAYALGEK